MLRCYTGSISELQSGLQKRLARLLCEHTVCMFNGKHTYLHTYMQTM